MTAACPINVGAATFGGMKGTTQYSPIESADAPIRFTDVSVGAPGASLLMQPCSGVLWPRELLGVMGPSGAGKTLLVKAWAGQAHGLRTDGGFTLDGKSLDENWFRSNVVFVPTEPILNPTLSVEATCQYYAGLTGHEYVDVADRLERFQMTGVRSVLAGALSSGQQKRLSVMNALWMNPRMLVLDEPTSGLSDADALAVMELLRDLSASRTVVCVLHQPRTRIFKAFDRLALVRNGALIALNATDSILNSLGSSCPAEESVAAFLMDVVSDRNFDVPSFQAALKNHEPSAQRKTEAFYGRPRTPSWWERFLICCATDVRAGINNRGYVVGHLAINAFVLASYGVVFATPTEDPLGAIFQFNACLFFFLVGIYFLFTSFKMEELEIERRQFKQDHFNRLVTPLMYFVSSCASDTIYTLLATPILTPTFLYFLRLPLDALQPVVRTALLMWLTLTVALLYRKLAFALIATPNTRFILQRNLDVVILGFNGVFVPRQDIPSGLQWICFLNPFYYIIQALFDTWGVEYNRDEVVTFPLAIACLFVILGVFVLISTARLHWIY